MSAREEFKGFESLTNLGAVRELLVGLGIQVVLHGHKHEGALFWDYVADQQYLSASPARLLVTAAPADSDPVCLSRVSSISASSVRARDSNRGRLCRGAPKRTDQTPARRTRAALGGTGCNVGVGFAR